jgi:hypothetical protein
LLVKFTLLSRWCDGIKNPAIGDAGFYVCGHKLVAITGNRSSRVFWGRTGR